MSDTFKRIKIPNFQIKFPIFIIILTELEILLIFSNIIFSGLKNYLSKRMTSFLIVMPVILACYTIKASINYSYLDFLIIWLEKLMCSIESIYFDLTKFNINIWNFLYIFVIIIQLIYIFVIMLKAYSTFRKHEKYFHGNKSYNRFKYKNHFKSIVTICHIYLVYHMVCMLFMIPITFKMFFLYFLRLILMFGILSTMTFKQRNKNAYFKAASLVLIIISLNISLYIFLIELYYGFTAKADKIKIMISTRQILITFISTYFVYKEYMFVK